MSEREWVVNASPVILLGKVGHLDLLELLCTQMVIPAAVVAEVCAEPHRDAGQDWLRSQSTLRQTIKQTCQRRIVQNASRLR